jgi:hypothetical protein
MAHGDGFGSLLFTKEVHRRQVNRHEVARDKGPTPRDRDNYLACHFSVYPSVAS